MDSPLFDCNCMVGRYPAGDVEFHDVSGLQSEMARLQIGRALVFHSLAWHHDPMTGNRLLLEQLQGAPHLVPCWVILPNTAGELGTYEEFMRDLAAGGVKAVRAFPRDHSYRLAGPDCAELLRRLAVHRLPLLVDLEQSDWGEIEAVAGANPNLPVIVCRVGYRSLRRIAGILERQPNVCVDLSYFSSHLGLEWVAERFGAKRVLFGTGMPVVDAGGAITRLRFSELREPELAAVAHGNLEQLLGEVSF